jgi:hypothetical protein
MVSDDDWETFGYPDTPGWKEPTTSREAAEAIESIAITIRGEALRELKKSKQYTPPGLTPDQVAKAIGRTVLAVRPRITELKNRELIVKTGEKRLNVSGLRAAVWVAVSV